MKQIKYLILGKPVTRIPIMAKQVFHQPKIALKNTILGLGFV